MAGTKRHELAKIRYSRWTIAEQRTGVDGIEEVVSLSWLLDVRVDEERVGLGVDVFDHDLESVEAASLRDLNLRAETLEEVLIHDAVRGGEEGKNVRDEVSLVIIEPVVPVVEILRQVDLFGSPEGRLGLLVHLPDLDGCQYRRPFGSTPLSRAWRVETRY